jgi:hypothetical protein
MGASSPFDYENSMDDLAVEATVGLGHVTGTFEAVAARFTHDHQDTQICTTGPLTWSSERTGSSAARLTAANVPDGMGFTRGRVTDDVAEVVKRIEP